MEQALKELFWLQVFVVASMALVIISIIINIIKKTTDIGNRDVRAVLCFVTCSALALFLIYFVTLHYPDFLAYYEYNHDLAEETIGVIDRIESGGGQHLYFIIDNTKYTMARDNPPPYDPYIREGDVVKIRFGEQSMYIFDIYELNVPPD